MLFSQREVSTTAFETLFSVDSTSSAALKGRSIVKHVGNARERGTWTCSKCQGISSCTHIIQSKRLLPEEFGDHLEHMQVAENAMTVDINSLCRNLFSKTMLHSLILFNSAWSGHYGLVFTNNASQMGFITNRRKVVSVSGPHP